MSKHKRVFDVGDRVMVIHTEEKPYSYAETLNKFGVVESVFRRGNSSTSWVYGILIDGIINIASSRNVFWFNASELAPEDSNNISINESEETTMNLSIHENFRTAMVSYPCTETEGKCRKVALFDSDVQVGDNVIFRDDNGLLICAVVREISTDESLKTKVGVREIIAKIDFSDYERRVAIRREMKELKQSMDIKASALQELALFEMLSEKDPELKVMLCRYKDLLSGHTTDEIKNRSEVSTDV